MPRATLELTVTRCREARVVTTGERLDTETVTSRSGRGRGKRADCRSRAGGLLYLMHGSGAETGGAIPSPTVTRPPIASAPASLPLPAVAHRGRSAPSFHIMC